MIDDNVSQCTKCKEKNVKIIAKGLCSKCYQKKAELQNSSQDRTKGLASRLLTKEMLTKLYISKKLSLGEIAKEAGCSRQFVAKKMKEYDIPLRTKSQARELALKGGKIEYEIKDHLGKSRKVKHQKNEFNHNFFGTWSAEMAWVLGLVVTDGCLTKSKAKHGHKYYKRFNIAQKEIEILEKVNFLLDSNIKLKKQPNGKINEEWNSIYVIDAISEQIYDDLLKLGVTPQKSLNIKFPDVPKEYIHHFIRGCWDGDGSISLSGSHFKVSYISGSIHFISKLKDILISAGINVKEDYRRNGENYSYTLYTNRLKDIEKLYYYLYAHVDKKIYLERKHELFVNAVSRIRKRENHKEYLKKLNKK